MGIALLLAAGALMLTRGNDPDADYGTIAEGEETASAGDPPPQILGPVDAERSRWLKGSKNACADDPWNAFDGKCKGKIVHKHLTVRAPSNGARGLRLALGRSNAPAITPMIDADSGAADPPIKGAATSGKADHFRSASMKGHKISRSGNGSREWGRPRAWPDDPWNARASAWPGSFAPNAHLRPRWGW